MNFLDIVAMEERRIAIEVCQSLHESVIDTLRESSDSELVESFVILMEAEATISKAEKQANNTGVKLFKAASGEKSFAIINKNKVIYITDAGRKLILTPSEWVVFEKSILDTGVKRVKDKSEMHGFMKFMNKVSPSLSKAMQVLVAYGIRIVAVTVGAAYSKAIVTGIANTRKLNNGEPLGKTIIDIIMGDSKTLQTTEVGGWTALKGLRLFERDISHEN